MQALRNPLFVKDILSKEIKDRMWVRKGYPISEMLTQEEHGALKHQAKQHRQDLESAVQDFLAKGGVIQQLN